MRDVVSLYKSGMSIRAVAAELSLSTDRVMRQMRLAGIMSRPKHQDRYEIDEEKMIERYCGGERISDIAQSFGVNHGTISGRLRRRQIIGSSSPKDTKVLVDVQEVNDRKAQGESVVSIARSLRVSQSTVSSMIVSESGNSDATVDCEVVVAFWCETGSLSSTCKHFGMSTNRLLEVLIAAGVSAAYLGASHAERNAARTIVARRMYSQGASYSEIGKVIGGERFAARRYANGK